MSFFASFTPEQRSRFEEASVVLVVPPGDHLVRRGEPGGDLFVVEQGELEVVDRRGRSRTVLAVLHEGALIGEVSYLDAAPRSADVVARTETRVRRWTREDLFDLTRRDPELGTALHLTLARTAAERLRRLSHSASTASADGSRTGTDQLAVAHTVAAARDHLQDADIALRAAPDDPTVEPRLREGLDALERDVAALFAHHADARTTEAQRAALQRALAPWLVRARVPELSLDPQRAAVVSAELVDHVLTARPEGRDRLGEMIDRWLLHRPTLHAMRRAEHAALAMVGARPDRRMSMLGLFDTPAPSRLDALAAACRRTPDATVWLIDPSRETLGMAARHMSARYGLRIRAAQIAPLGLVTGQSSPPFGALDVIVLGDLLSYLPDRLALASLRRIRQFLASDGIVVLGGLIPSDDQALLGQVLDWPTIRRTPAHLRRLAARAGLGASFVDGVPAPGWTAVLDPVFEASRSA